MHLSVLAYGSLLFASALWAGFGGLVWQLGVERTAYAEAVERAKQESIRGESSARLRASIQGTEAEREALESLVRLSILQAVETVEQSGVAAGATDVEIGEASPATAPEGFSAVTIVVNASGQFSALARAVSLFEALPIPAKLEQFEIVKAEQEKTWRLTARLSVLHASSQ